MQHLKPLLFLMAWLLTAQPYLIAQFPAVSVEFVNTTGWPDDSVFVAIVGQNYSSEAYVWIDLVTGQRNFMSTADNTVKGPVYGGDMGPGGNAMYADCFTPISEIPNKSVPLDTIQGCRIFLSIRQQLYLYFFDQVNAKGYAAPDPNNPNDPNKGIIYEFTELTYDTFGVFFVNVSRVDSYKRPLSVELFSDAENYQKRVGDMAGHREIIEAFPNSVPAEFQSCLNLTDSTITQPSKITDFQPGGPFADYFDDYVNAVWNKYDTVDLVFTTSNGCLWSGRVSAGDTLAVTCISGNAGMMGKVGRVGGRPTTLDIFEGSGLLKDTVMDPIIDPAIQAQICAAFNRHLIDTINADPGQQDWGDSSGYYLADPANHYAKFWHLPGISFERLAYGFAYDDVWDFESIAKTPNPSKLIVYFGDPEIDDFVDGLRRLPEQDRLKAYPSFTRDWCMVAGLERSRQLWVFDAGGRLVLERKLDPLQTEVRLDLSPLPPGVYFIQIRSERWWDALKVVRM